MSHKWDTTINNITKAMLRNHETSSFWLFPLLSSGCLDLEQHKVNSWVTDTLAFCFLKPLTHKSGSRNDTYTSALPTFLHSVKSLWVSCKQKLDCFAIYYLFMYSFIYLLWCWKFNLEFHTCQASAVPLSYFANLFAVIWQVASIQASHTDTSHHSWLALE